MKNTVHRRSLSALGKGKALVCVLSVDAGFWALHSGCSHPLPAPGCGEDRGEDHGAGARGRWWPLQTHRPDGEAAAPGPLLPRSTMSHLAHDFSDIFCKAALKLTAAREEKPSLILKNVLEQIRGLCLCGSCRVSVPHLPVPILSPIVSHTLLCGWACSLRCHQRWPGRPIPLG